jgi:hypothetical protein
MTICVVHTGHRAHQQCTRLYTRQWSKEEVEVLEMALKEVMQRAGEGFTVREVAEKFRKRNRSLRAA